MALFQVSLPVPPGNYKVQTNLSRHSKTKITMFSFLFQETQHIRGPACKGVLHVHRTHASHLNPAWKLLLVFQTHCRETPHLHGPARARVDLVVHHVLEPLVVGGPQENLASLEHAAGVPVVHGFVAALLVAALVQSRRDVLHRHVREGGGVALLCNSTQASAREL